MTTTLTCCFITALLSSVSGYYISILANANSNPNGKTMDWKTALILIGLATLAGGIGYFVTTKMSFHSSYVNDYTGWYAEVVSEDDVQIELCQSSVTFDGEKNSFQIEGTAYAVIGKGAEKVGSFHTFDTKFIDEQRKINYQFWGIENGIAFGLPENEIGPGYGYIIFESPNEKGFQFARGEFYSPICGCWRSFGFQRIDRPLPLKDLSSDKAIKEIQNSFLKGPMKVSLQPKSNAKNTMRNKKAIPELAGAKKPLHVAPSEKRQQGTSPRQELEEETVQEGKPFTRN